MSVIIKKFNVDGMSCSHCERAIKNSLNELEGVQGVEVDLAGKAVTVQYDSNIVGEQNITESIEEAGYEVN